jgi:electron transfer flavoprotein beta subunit
MNVAVVLRLMPNLGDELELDASGTDIDRGAVGMVINEWDDQALEQAVLFKEATGATVTAIALRAEGMEPALRVAFARGADSALIVDAGEVSPYDARTAALALAEGLRGLAPDLVLVGVQTPHDVLGQTAPYLAAVLGWPQANVVSSVTLVDGKARVLQEYAGGRAAVLDLELPAVIGVQAASSPPRYVSMSRLRQALTGAGAATVSVSVAAPARSSTIVSLARPERRGGATMLDGGPSEVAAQIAALLREQRVLEG